MCVTSVCNIPCVWIINPRDITFEYPFSCCTGQHKPAGSYEKITINKNSRATLNSLRHIIRKNKYRKDLRMAALRRASAILKSQKPVVVKKKRTRAAKTA
ncbi:60S ribosomal protein L28 isoform 3 [Scophthalmus maximus]|uniref:Large ribosomal subunit protein eL28 n=1 Tax=Scophthalmus maximus TaxID=52904 RepID=A0A2U9CFV7_SCOMX|nr:60S ribosomal protein L28 isoform 3 [Scophthalmus maximus]